MNEYSKLGRQVKKYIDGSNQALANTTSKAILNLTNVIKKEFALLEKDISELSLEEGKIHPDLLSMYEIEHT